jgi:hypothetical protein
MFSARKQRSGRTPGNTGYNNETAIIFDLSRTQVDKIDHIYDLVESFKNGSIF